MKAEIEAAFEKNDFSNLPFLSCYRFEGGETTMGASIEPRVLIADYFYSIVREPLPNENIDATFGPPSLEDAAEWWGYVMKNTERDIIFTYIELTSNLLQAKKDKASQSTKLFLQQLLFEHAFQYLKSLNYAKDLSQEEKRILGKVKDTFHSFLPNDEKTKYLDSWKY